MALYIQKFGGTSVANIDCIRRVANIITKTREQGHNVIAVVSAMHGETDRLIDLAHTAVEAPCPREFDALVSTGEQVSAALLSMTLISLSHPARSYTGGQARIRTTNHHRKATILDIDIELMRRDLQEGRIPVVTGFQGVDVDGNITTIGRGGSDITAVAIASAFNAVECQIYTDVEGVFTTDPRVVKEARRLNQITFEEMLELSSLGAKVLQIRAVEFAQKFNVPVRVLSTFQQGPGTLITFNRELAREPIVSGIAFDRNQAKITVLGIPKQPESTSHLLSALSVANVEVDMIIQNVASQDKNVDLSFTVHLDDFASALEIAEKLADKISAQQVISDERIAKLSVVGVGMKSHASVASKMLQVLGEEGIDIHLITSSEVKISTVIDEKYMELGARILHGAFGLGQDKKLNNI